MGATAIFKCEKCGFETDELSLGPGFAVFLEAFICQDCHHIMEKPINDDWTILEGHEECDRCGKSNLIKWDNNCPKCGGFMELEPVGMWD
jgi:ribosomal protein L37E